MDARIQKHRMMGWVGRLLIMLLVVTFPSVALSTIEEVAPIHLQMWTACSNGSKLYLASTPQEACKKFVLASPPALALTDLGYTATSATSGYCTQLRNQYPDHPQLNYCGAGFITVSITCPPASPAYTLVGTSPNNILMCKRNIPDDLTISLSGGDQIEPSKGSSLNNLPITATVVNESNNQPPTTPVKVRISIKVEAHSGGHDHGDSTRPRGKIENKECESDAECWSGMTDPSGKVVFNFKSPEAAGKHTITATCDGCTNNPQPKDVNVMVDGLLPIPASTFYALNEANGDVIGARPGWHSDNHNLSPEAEQMLLKIALIYRYHPQFMLVADKKTGRKEFPPVLHLNDASLPWGGVYDICARPGACTENGIVAWYGPHAEHRRGSVIDVRANGNSGSIPALNKDKFAKYLKRKKVSHLHESIGSSNEHFHIRLLGKKE